MAGHYAALHRKKGNIVFVPTKEHGRRNKEAVVEMQFLVRIPSKEGKAKRKETQRKEFQAIKRSHTNSEHFKRLEQPSCQKDFDAQFSYLLFSFFLHFQKKFSSAAHFGNCETIDVPKMCRYVKVSPRRLQNKQCRLGFCICFLQNTCSAILCKAWSTDRPSFRL